MPSFLQSPKVFCSLQRVPMMAQNFQITWSGKLNYKIIERAMMTELIARNVMVLSKFDLGEWLWVYKCFGSCCCCDRPSFRLQIITPNSSHTRNINMAAPLWWWQQNRGGFQLIVLAATKSRWNPASAGGS